MLIAGTPLVVVGFHKAVQLTSSGNSGKGWIHVPLSTIQRRVHDSNGLTSISVSVRDGYDIEKTAGVIREFLAQSHRTSLASIRVMTAKMLADNIRALEKKSRRILYAIGGVAMMLAFSVISIVFVSSVHERRLEIGLRRALGASKQDVAVEYLASAAVVCIFGAVVSTTLFYMATFFLLKSYMSLDWSFIALVNLLAILVGLVSGTVPALKAARIEPAMALKNS